MNTRTEIQLLMITLVCALAGYVQLAGAQYHQEIRPIFVEASKQNLSQELPHSFATQNSVSNKEVTDREFSISQTSDTTLQADTREFRSLLLNARLTGREALAFVNLFSGDNTPELTQIENDINFLRDHRFHYCIENDAGGRSGQEATKR